MDNQRLIEALGLDPHPGGGFSAEIYRSEGTLPLPRGVRAVCTHAVFLFPAGSFGAIRRIRADEVWTFHDGDPLDLHIMDDAGRRTTATLGRDVGNGQRPAVVVPAGLWQAAVPRGTRGTLCGLTAAPGFDAADATIPTRAEIVRRFPEHADWLATVTR